MTLAAYAGDKLIDVIIYLRSFLFAVFMFLDL